MARNSAKISQEEWEKICLRCGRCCLLKLQDDDTDEIYYTNVICHYYDIASSILKIIQSEISN